MNNIFLVGFMGVGKSTIAKELKKILDMNLVEMDARIVHEQGMSINEIFEKYGENYFRDIESKLVLDIGDEGNTIVSCGGGVVLRPENVEHMRQSGKVVYLTATPESIFERVKNGNERPILNGNMNVDYIKGLMEKRKPFYEAAADIMIETDNKSIEKICQEIQSKI